MGSIQVHFALSAAYHEDMYGHDHDLELEISQYHAERAAIGGHPLARYNLGVMKKERGQSRQSSNALEHSC